MLLRLADERAGDQLDLGRAVSRDVFEHRRAMCVPALRREHVHLPRILPELDAGRARRRLALVDERVHERAELLPRRSGGRAAAR